jgi:hypothetical protein
MVEDPRRIRSSEELANAVFGSALPTAEQQRQREEQHKAAQVPPPATEEVRRPGWLPPGYCTSNTEGEFAFRNMTPPTEADLERMKRNTMAEVVRHQRKGGGG